MEDVHDPVGRDPVVRRVVEGRQIRLGAGVPGAQAHGGQIKAANAVPHGAIFTVTLPQI